jgi:mRNA-degrading endonuclease RelE of RelBE toxin-antitoxin system
MYIVKLKKKAVKGINKMPDNIKEKLLLLVDDLKEKGPVLHEWANYSKLEKNEYHCHLSYSWVACW